MHAPEYACRELYSLSPQFRWCWLGGKRKGDELNPGCFGLIRLMEPDAGACRMDIADYKLVRRAGPIYSRGGVPHQRDWSDRLEPFLILRLDGSRPAMGWSTRHVLGSHFINKQRKDMALQWVFDRKLHNFLLDKGKDAEAALVDAAGETASRFEYENRFNPAYTLMSKEDIRAAIAAEGPDFDPRGPDFTNTYLEKYGSHLRINPT